MDKEPKKKPLANLKNPKFVGIAVLIIALTFVDHFVKIPFGPLGDFLMDSVRLIVMGTFLYMVMTGEFK